MTTPLRTEVDLLLAGQKAHVFVSTNPLDPDLLESELKVATGMGLYALELSWGSASDVLDALHRALRLHDPDNFLTAVAAAAPLSANLPEIARQGDNIFGLAWATAYYLRRSKTRGVIVFDPDREYRSLDLVVAVLQILHRESGGQLCVVLGPMVQRFVELFPDLDVIRHPAPLGSPPPARADEPATAPPAADPPAGGPAAAESPGS